eukprot:6176699-Pleurochrysis_carterae.AAC.1
MPSKPAQPGHVMKLFSKTVPLLQNCVLACMLLVGRWSVERTMQSTLSVIIIISITVLVTSVSHVSYESRTYAMRVAASRKLQPAIGTNDFVMDNGCKHIMEHGTEIHALCKVKFNLQWKITLLRSISK